MGYTALYELGRSAGSVLSDLGEGEGSEEEPTVVIWIICATFCSDVI